ncbi:hypothetical protein V565_061650 [Rhizoctonia solani 123E]|uniref:Uncharacterized protein n=1 Tax=Rhizoctonia solani 123E TaxID=1423351 RepID=A0A074RWE3_9AGAM|nr:hypothetical protein V565_061650 [Rhizoctonia solani 123E]
MTSPSLALPLHPIFHTRKNRSLLDYVPNVRRYGKNRSLWGRISSTLRWSPRSTLVRPLPTRISKSNMPVSKQNSPASALIPLLPLSTRPTSRPRPTSNDLNRNTSNYKMNSWLTNKRWKKRLEQPPSTRLGLFCSMGSRHASILCESKWTHCVPRSRGWKKIWQMKRRM